jgi:enoyl-CoA hydratase
MKEFPGGFIGLYFLLKSLIQADIFLFKRINFCPFFVHLFERLKSGGHHFSLLCQFRYFPDIHGAPEVICAVNGAAIGGGLCLALGGDVRIAGESAYFRAAGINNGLTATELGLSFLLPRAIGSSRAFEMALSGRDVSAREAAEIGLVSRVVPDAELMPGALDLADQINGWSTQGVQLTKRMMWAGLEAGSLQAAIELESHTQLFVRMTTQNFEEATLARKEGRKPDFRD